MKNPGENEPMQSQLQFNYDDSVSRWTYDPNTVGKSLGRLIAATDLPIRFGDSSFCEDHIKRSYRLQFQKVSRTNH